jgi:hypothetical protein
MTTAATTTSEPAATVLRIFQISTPGWSVRWDRWSPHRQRSGAQTPITTGRSHRWARKWNGP